VIRQALRTKLRRGYCYSNVGYSLLAAIVERASGLGYERYLRRFLLAPAGMRQTGYVLPDFRDVAVEYDADGAPHGHPHAVRLIKG
jgi:CubicO group peptidase (beta-lactamase class C family)